MLLCLTQCVIEVFVVFSSELKGLTINPVGGKKKSKGRLEFAVAPSESFNWTENRKKGKIYVELK